MSLSGSNNLEYLFTTGKDVLPGYVGAMPSIKVALTVSCSILLIGVIITLIDKQMNSTSDKSTSRYRWIIFLLITVYVASSAYTPVQRKMYMIHNFRRNSQHFANVFWLKEYMEAFNMMNGKVGL